VPLLFVSARFGTSRFQFAAASAAPQMPFSRVTPIDQQSLNAVPCKTFFSRSSTDFSRKLSAHLLAMGDNPECADGLCLVNAVPLASIATSGGGWFLVPRGNYFISNKTRNNKNRRQDPSLPNKTPAVVAHMAMTNRTGGRNPATSRN
jgi:hypothetical protein